MSRARYRTTLASIACAGVLFLAGCSSDNPVNPNGFTQADADDIAAQAGQAMTAGALANMDASDGASGGVSGSPAARFVPTHPVGSVAQAETTWTNGNVTYTLGVTFYDASNNPLSGYGPTAYRMLVTTRATGDFANQQFSASLGHAGSLDVLGIDAASDTLLFNGACNDTVEATFQSLDGLRERYFKWRSAGVLTDVPLLKDRNVNPYPLSGTLTFVVHAERFRSNQFSQVDKTWDATVTIVFNGTDTPDLTVNGVFHYQVNLVTGAVVRAGTLG